MVAHETVAPGPLPLPVGHQPAAADDQLDGLGMVGNGHQAFFCNGRSVLANQAVGQGYHQIDTVWMVPETRLQNGG